MNKSSKFLYIFAINFFAITTISSFCISISKEEQEIIEKNRYRDKLLTEKASLSHKIHNLSHNCLVAGAVIITGATIIIFSGGAVDSFKYGDYKDVVVSLGIDAASLATFFGFNKLNNKYIRPSLEEECKRTELDFDQRRKNGKF
jgi:hypothetical protein